MSLYSGCGGLDLGFEQADFEIGLAYDIDAHAIASWNHNRNNAQQGQVADISHISLKDMDRHHGGKFEPTGVIGGPPCQSFSRANLFRSASDVRRHHVRKFFSVALRFHYYRPPLNFILMENVPELADAEGGGLLKKEIKRLRLHGFEVHEFLLNAVRYAVPQRRNRLFLLAIHRSKLRNPWSTPDGNNKTVTVRDVIMEFPDPVHFKRGIKVDASSFHPNHWCMNPVSKKFGDGTLAQGYSSGRSFKTLSWDLPSITASYGHREVHIHPNGKRRLSVLEAMSLQGFPREYILKGTLSAQIDQVSEAVPPPLAKAVATGVRASLGL